MSTALITRFKFHNEKSTKGFITRYMPWHVEFFDLKVEALKREKYLRTGVGRAWVKEKNLTNQF
ncbi:hypothetical protein MM239_03890 [Belliella sp. DSM 111904]|uniref:Endonuclease n=2 Tax=Belliella filtrata TaxID=2923435 RepID=A0ABS9UWI8_9BACT|nr:hypothetical protein [Belliella filtrata]